MSFKKYRKHQNYFGSEPFVGLKELISTKDISNWTAIDIGCGQGRDTLFLAREGFHVKSIDIDPTAIKYIKKIAKRESLIIDSQVGNIVDIELLIDSYNIGIARTIFDHLQPDHIPQVIEKFKHSIIQNGYVFVSVFTQDDPGYRGNKAKESECSSNIKYYFPRGKLKLFFSDWDIISYKEYIKEDLSHGRPHTHGITKMFAQKKR